MKKYRVIFNGDINNYEEFETLEQAQRFASRYLGGIKIVEVDYEK